MTTDLADGEITGIWCDEENVTVCWGPVSVMMDHEEFTDFAVTVAQAAKAAEALKSSHVASIGLTPPLRVMR